MQLSLDHFKSLSWQGNLFQLVETSERRICIEVHELALPGRPPSKVLLSFSAPKSEWAMLWDERTESWVEHPDRQGAPIGPAIVEAWIKPSRIGLLLSFAGHHPAGWSRWGFNSQGILATPVAL